MSQVTDAFRSHHQALAKELSKHVSSLAEGKAGADPKAFAVFLRQELLSHAQGEEAHLYPLMDTLVCAHGKPTATMSLEHQYIEKYVSEIEKASAKVPATPQEQTAQRETLTRLGLQLGAIFDVHLAKEEQVYLPLFEQYVSPQDQQAVLDAMHETEPSNVQALDVRTIPPYQRHPLIFGTFEALAPGSAFELVNDHDPKPLYYQFAAEMPGMFNWDYIERGPEIWRVRIAKTAEAESVAKSGGAG